MDIVMRGMGTCYRQAGSRFWWIQYWHEGKRYQESSGCEKLRDAQNLLRKKLLAFQAGVRPPNSELLVRDLYFSLEKDYEINGRKSARNVSSVWQNHLAAFFGNQVAATLTTDQVTDYISLRQKEGAKNATVNRELAALKRMFTLAIRTRKLLMKPYIPQLLERNTRKGFVRDLDYSALALETGKIGIWLRAIFEIGFSYGFRKSELLGMRVRQIDMNEKTIVLDPDSTKTGEARVVDLTRRAFDLLGQCIAGKQPEDYVFTRNGQRIVEFRDAWKRATIAAGCPGLLVHDLRRSAVRNLVRSGVSEKVAMQISGHRTRSVFDRYNIIDQADLRDAARKLDGAAQERQRLEVQSEMFSDVPAERKIQ